MKHTIELMLETLTLNMLMENNEDLRLLQVINLLQEYLEIEQKA